MIFSFSKGEPFLDLKLVS